VEHCGVFWLNFRILDVIKKQVRAFDVLRSFSGDGVLMCSIDNMPAQLPRESTEYFGSLLMPHVFDIVRMIISLRNTTYYVYTRCWISEDGSTFHSL